MLFLGCWSWSSLLWPTGWTGPLLLGPRRDLFMIPRDVVMLKLYVGLGIIPKDIDGRWRVWGCIPHSGPTYQPYLSTSWSPSMISLSQISPPCQAFPSPCLSLWFSFLKILTQGYIDWLISERRREEKRDRDRDPDRCAPLQGSNPQPRNVHGWGLNMQLFGVRNNAPTNQATRSGHVSSLILFTPLVWNFHFLLLCFPGKTTTLRFCLSKYGVFRKKIYIFKNACLSPVHCLTQNRSPTNACWMYNPEGMAVILETFFIFLKKINLITNCAFTA